MKRLAAVLSILVLTAGTALAGTSDTNHQLYHQGSAIHQPQPGGQASDQAEPKATCPNHDKGKHHKQHQGDHQGDQAGTPDRGGQPQGGGTAR